jgi:hypothetical protein
VTGQAVKVHAAEGARDIAAEMEHLFRRQIALLKSGTFAGWKSSQLAELDKIGARISELFKKLQNSL